MRSDTNQLDILRDDPARLAQVWRAAAEASAKQFPNDTKRLNYYESKAQSYERLAGRELK